MPPNAASDAAAPSQPQQPRKPPRMVVAIPKALTRGPVFGAATVLPEDRAVRELPPLPNALRDPAEKKDNLIPEPASTAQSGVEPDSGIVEASSPPIEEASEASKAVADNDSTTQTDLIQDEPHGQPPLATSEPVPAAIEPSPTPPVEPTSASPTQHSPHSDDPAQSRSPLRSQALTGAAVSYVPSAADVQRPSPPEEWLSYPEVVGPSQPEALAEAASRHSRPSLDNIVFGATQGSPAVLSTPRGPTPRLPPGLDGAQPATPFYPDHLQHLSEPQPLVLDFTTQSHADGIHASEANTYPSQNNLFQSQPTGQYSPHTTLVNGVSRPHSQTSSRAHINGTGLTPETDELYPDHVPLEAIVNDPGFQEYFREFRGPQIFEKHYQESHAHLMSIMNDARMADCVLRVHSPFGLVLEKPVHRVFVSKSPTIAARLQQQSSTQQPVIDIVTMDKYVTQPALMEVLKSLYLAPLIPLDFFSHGLPPFDPRGEQGPYFDEARTRMLQAIGYASVGRLLGLPTICAHGNEIIKTLLRWDTIDLVFSFGLTMGFHTATQQIGTLQHVSTTLQPRAELPLTPWELRFAQALYLDCIAFITSGFPFFESPSEARFQLDITVPEMKDSPRLPAVKSGNHNPRLSQIRFGDVPSAPDENQSTFITRWLSSLLISIPLHVVDDILNSSHIVNKLGPAEVRRIMSEVVSERERRREGVFQQRYSIDASHPLLKNVLWREFLSGHPTKPSGSSLLSRRIQLAQT